MSAIPSLSADWLHASPVQAVIAALEARDPDCVRFVGGCVRNAVMGRPAGDIDFATRLVPDDTLRALHAAGIRTLSRAMKYGTITAIVAGQAFEITSLRRDVKNDGRHPVVAFTRDWDEDARRRDFRFNALYAKPDGTVLDPVGGGYHDALAGRIVFIGDPGQRLAEDYLRILRFFRFNAWYGHNIDPDGLAACARCKVGLGRISRERIWQELKKLLSAPDPLTAVNAMVASGVLGTVLPACRGTQGFGALIATEKRVGVPPDPVRRLMALIGQSAEAIGSVCHALRLSKVEARRLDVWSTVAVRVSGDMPAHALRASLYRFGQQAVIDHALLSGSDAGAVMSTAKTWKRPDFPVNGQDALAAGHRDSAVARALDRAQDAWIDSDFTLDRASLLDILSKPGPHV